jgi:hypothetical protein
MEDVLRLFIPILALSIPIVAIVMTNWSRVQRQRLVLMEKGATDLTRAAEHRIERLEARVAVLERIATDRRPSLAAEIDQLALTGLTAATGRDAPPVERT